MIVGQVSIRENGEGQVRTYRHLTIGRAKGGRICGNALGRAKVSKFDRAVVCDQDVRALDVTVSDAVAVQVLQPKQDLPRVHPNNLNDRHIRMG